MASPPGKPVVTVDDFAALAKLAERYGQMVLTWTRPDAADTALVDCAKPHLFEQAGSVTLTDQVALPDDQTLRQLVNDRCNPVVVTYLGGQQ